MSVNRERQKVSRCMENLDLEYSTLEDAALEIKSLIERYGKDATIKQYSDYDDERLGVFVLVDETDAEMANRIAREEKWEAERKVRERAEFERLQKLYGV
jgi:hypothetical protein